MSPVNASMRDPMSLRVTKAGPEPRFQAGRGVLVPDGRGVVLDQWGGGELRPSTE